MAIIGAIEIGPKLDAAVDAIVAQDRRTRRARGIKSDAAARDIKAAGRTGATKAHAASVRSVS